jgi:putative hydrolase of the HAD superfamily
MPIRAILFDLDETLMIEEASIQESLFATCQLAKQRYDIAPAQLVASIRLRAKELWRSFPTFEACMAIGISSWEGLAADFTGEISLLKELQKLIPSYRQETWLRGLADHGVRDEKLATKLAQDFPLERRKRHILFSETRVVLDELHSQYAFGMITNGPPQHQREKLSAAGLTDYFEYLVVSGDIGIGKPDERIFHHALNQLGLKPSEAIMIGDSLERDILGAERAGLLSVWINRYGAVRSSSQPRPSKEIANLRELQAVLKEVPQ